LEAEAEGSFRLTKKRKAFFLAAWEELIGIIGPRVVPVEEMGGVIGYDS
jgi:hypothetical protein